MTNTSILFLIFSCILGTRDIRWHLEHSSIISTFVTKVKIPTLNQQKNKPYNGYIYIFYC